jgi:hypothetical protein
MPAMSEEYELVQITNLYYRLVLEAIKTHFFVIKTNNSEKKRFLESQKTPKHIKKTPNSLAFF